MRERNTSAPLPAEADQSIAACLAKTLTGFAERVAIDDGECALTYAEIDHITDQIARTLYDRLPPDGGTVALVLDHGIPALLGIVAALKSGRPYVPLDPTFAPQKSAAILADADAALVLTDRKNLPVVDQLNAGRYGRLNIDDVDLGTPREAFASATEGTQSPRSITPPGRPAHPRESSSLTVWFCSMP